jgi:hypothetical protein
VRQLPKIDHINFPVPGPGHRKLAILIFGGWTFAAKN